MAVGRSQEQLPRGWLIEYRLGETTYWINLYARGKKRILYVRYRTSGEPKYVTARSTRTADPDKAERIAKSQIRNNQNRLDTFAEWAIANWDWHTSSRIGLKRKADPTWAGQDHCYNIQTQLRKYLPRVFSRRKLNDIRPKDLLVLANFLLDKRCKVNTVRNILTATCTSLKYAYLMGLTTVANWPAPPLRSNETSRRPFTKDEVARLLSASESMPELHTTIKIAYCTGARIREILAMRVNDIREDHLLIDQAHTRSGVEKLPKGNKIRKVAMSTALEEYLRQITVGRAPGDFIVTEQNRPSVSPDYRRLLRAFHHACSLAGISRSLGDAFHSLRHAHATELARQVPMELVQQHLGHASPETTRRYTALVVPPPSSDVRRAVSAIEPKRETSTPPLKVLKALQVKDRDGLERLLSILKRHGFVDQCWDEVSDHFTQGEQGNLAVAPSSRVNIIGRTQITDYIRLVSLVMNRFLETQSLAVVLEHFSIKGCCRNLESLRDNIRKRKKLAEPTQFNSGLLEKAVQQALAE